MAKLNGIKRLAVIEALIKQDENTIYNNIEHIVDLYQHFSDIGNGEPEVFFGFYHNAQKRKIKVALETMRWIDDQISKLSNDTQVTLTLSGYK